MPQLVGKKLLEIQIMATTAVLKRKNKKCGPEEVYACQGLIRNWSHKRKINECLGELFLTNQ